MAKKRTERAAEACPCGSGGAYAACCGRYLDGDERPLTAERLMRSRYTAFVRGRADYLLETWHAATRPPSLELEPGVKWLGLSIAHTQAGGPEDAEGWVEFVARSKRGGRAQRLHERSRFVREGGRWYYVDGRFDAPAQSTGRT